MSAGTSHNKTWLLHQNFNLSGGVQNYSNLQAPAFFVSKQDRFKVKATRAPTQNRENLYAHVLNRGLHNLSVRVIRHPTLKWLITPSIKASDYLDPSSSAFTKVVQALHPTLLTVVNYNTSPHTQVSVWVTPTRENECWERKGQTGAH